jgi:hypothetical protein
VVAASDGDRESLFQLGEPMELIEAFGGGVGFGDGSSVCLIRISEWTVDRCLQAGKSLNLDCVGATGWPARRFEPHGWRYDPLALDGAQDWQVTDYWANGTIEAELTECGDHLVARRDRELASGRE